MSHTYTLIIDKASESGALIGHLLEVPDQRFKSDDFNELCQMAQQVVSKHQKVADIDDEQFNIQCLFSDRFIASRRKDDPEIHLFGAIQATMAQHSISSFESAGAFAKIALNAMVLLNGGAIIALLTFYGNFLIKTSAELNISRLSYGVASYAIGLITALIACAIGFWCQNSQTVEMSRENALSSMEFYAKLGLTKINESQKEFLNKKIREPIISSHNLRLIAMLTAILSIIFFCSGSFYSLLSLYDNIQSTK